MSAHNTVQPLVYNGEIITQRDAMVSLTDMWKAAGSPDNQNPAQWLRTPSAEAFIEAVEVSVGKSHNEVVSTVRGGKKPGTWAHWQVSLAYAKYLSPEFHMWCNTVVRERMEGRQKATHLVMDEGMRNAIGGIVKSCTGVVVREALEVILPRLIESDPRAAATEFKPALDLLIERNVPSRRRRAFSQKVSSRLRRYSTSHGHPMRISRETGRYLFHVDAIGGWMRDEGQGLIASHVAAVSGQGVLPFKKPEAI